MALDRMGNWNMRWLTVLAALALVVGGCSDSSADRDAAPSIVDAPTTVANIGCDTSALTIGFAPASLTDAAWILAEAGAVEAVNAAGIDMAVAGPSDADGAMSQVAAIDSLVELGVDVLVVASIGAEDVAPAVARAGSAGVPVIALGTDIVHDDVWTLVSTDHAIAAHNQGQLVGEAIGGIGTVVYVSGDASDQRGRDQRADFVDTLADLFPDVDVVIVPTAWDAGAARAGVQDAIATIPDLAAIAHAWDGATAQTLELVEEAGIDPFIAGYDGSPGVIAAMERGAVDLIVAENWRQLAQLAVEAAIDISCGIPVDVRIGDHGTLLTPDSVGAFIADNPPLAKLVDDAR